MKKVAWLLEIPGEGGSHRNGLEQNWQDTHSA